MHQHDSGDIITYVHLSIASFTNTTIQVDKGNTVTSTTLNWTYNASTDAVKHQSINQGVGVIPVGTLTKALSGLTITDDFTWTLCRY